METLAAQFRALSEPIRLRIINLLSRGELCVCDLMAVLNLPQSTVSRHLASLKNAGLVASARKGTWMHYRLTSSKQPVQEELLRILQTGIEDTAQGAQDLQDLERHLAAREGNACA